MFFEAGVKNENFKLGYSHFKEKKWLYFGNEAQTKNFVLRKSGSEYVFTSL